MSIVLGIDTGGTYTDSVLVDLAAGQVLAKAKALTDKNNLLESIINSIGGLAVSGCRQPERVVLSTTLATNAVVEGRGQAAGLILIGRRPPGDFPAEVVRQVKGGLNIKGRETVSVDAAEVAEAAALMAGRVQALTVSGYLSVRNPAQELEVRRLVQQVCDLPVVCGHELASELGFYERTVTAVLNARLLPLIGDFLDAAEMALAGLGLKVPVYVVKGNGDMASVASIRERPVETILSGPAASLIGAVFLSRVKNALVLDMGGTTTDSALVRDGRVPMRKDGAIVGAWRTLVSSADIATVGLGGDSRIRINAGGRLVFGPERALPACRDQNEVPETLTPTDLLEASGRLNLWPGDKSKKALAAMAARLDLSEGEFLSLAEEEFLAAISEKCIQARLPKGEPLLAIGAPAGVWLAEAGARNNMEVIVPEHHEVANAVGAACAEIRFRLSALIRPGEDSRGFVLHLPDRREIFPDYDLALAYAAEALQQKVGALAQTHGAHFFESGLEREEVRVEGRFVETVLTLEGLGRISLKPKTISGKAAGPFAG